MFRERRFIVVASPIGNRLLDRAKVIGPHAAQWASAVLQARGVEGMRALIGLGQLVGNYSAQQVDAACKSALSHDALRLRTIRQLLKRGSAREDQTEFDFLEHHPVIRPLSDYSLESLHAFRKERHENVTT